LLIRQQNGYIQRNDFLYLKKLFSEIINFFERALETLTDRNFIRKMFYRTGLSYCKSRAKNKRMFWKYRARHLVTESPRRCMYSRITWIAYRPFEATITKRLLIWAHGNKTIAQLNSLSKRLLIKKGLEPRVTFEWSKIVTILFLSFFEKTFLIRFFYC
jgi:hypothetical protein